jgi:hypothetical protein
MEASQVTSLDREGFSYTRCDYCKKRRSQLVVDAQPHNKAGGKYEHYCWQCYWFYQRWKRGPVVNCGPMWDGVDERRAAPELQP